MEQVDHVALWGVGKRCLYGNTGDRCRRGELHRRVAFNHHSVRWTVQSLYLQCLTGHHDRCDDLHGGHPGQCGDAKTYLHLYRHAGQQCKRHGLHCRGAVDHPPVRRTGQNLHLQFVVGEYDRCDDEHGGHPGQLGDSETDLWLHRDGDDQFKRHGLYRGSRVARANQLQRTHENVYLQFVSGQHERRDDLHGGDPGQCGDTENNLNLHRDGGY